MADGSAFQRRLQISQFDQSIKREAKADTRIARGPNQCKIGAQYQMKYNIFEHNSTISFKSSQLVSLSISIYPIWFINTTIQHCELMIVNCNLHPDVKKKKRRQIKKSTNNNTKELICFFWRKIQRYSRRRWTMMNGSIIGMSKSIKTVTSTLYEEEE